MVRTIATLAAGLFLLACVSSSPSIPVSTLLAVPEAVEIDNRTYSLELHVWRNFMPPVDLRGEPLIVSVFVTAADGNGFPATLDADRIWVVDSELGVWETAFSDESRPAAPAHQLPKIARNGPRQSPSDLVDVVVRLVEDDGSEYLVGASNLTIEYPQ